MTTDAVRIAGIAYALPATSSTIRSLGRVGQLESAPELLESFGFESVRVATTETPYELALQAARTLVERNAIDPESIDLLISGGPQGPTAFVNAPSDGLSRASHRTLARFQFPGTRLQHDLGLTGASTLGMDQLACTTLLSAVRVARALCIAEGLDRALCVSSEFFPADAGRETLYNCSSDAAVAVLVERQDGPNRIVSSAHVTKGYHWNPEAARDEVVASYFPTARHVIDQTIDDAGWSRADVDWVIPHNVNERSWQILIGLTGLGHARLWSRNISRIGHTLAGDNFINLADALETGAIEPGQRLLLFSYGFGAHWIGLAVEA